MQNHNFGKKNAGLRLTQHFSEKQTQLAVLIDPDKASNGHLEQLASFAEEGFLQYFLVGGSLMFSNRHAFVIDYLKRSTTVPVIIFPGNPSQIYDKADAILLLSLISGRNADLLIGRHVEAAPALRSSGLEIISTGYILVDGGKATTVSYISNTTPLPAHKPDIAAATAMAGEMLGMHCIYLEAGSGALQPVPEEMIAAVRESVQIPLMVGGGIRHPEKAYKSAKAGANVIIMGNGVEANPLLVPEVAAALMEGSRIKNI
jgi:putative glycerol-1-phosphate prenyltransferase